MIEHGRDEVQGFALAGTDLDTRRRLVVLGGGSPFAIGLIDAIAGSPEAPPSDIVLCGRTPEATELVRTYGQAALAPRGWDVTCTTDPVRGLAGADVVLNQIRYGGLDGRRRDERLAADLGVPADETLGPAGLAAAIRIAPGLADLARTLIAHCPEAVVLNLANPLGCSTALLHRGGVTRAVGLCELPLVTARQACGILGLPVSDVEWTYAGLNHRGFIHRLASRGRDLLEELPATLGERTIGGITSAEIASLGAIPMKHFALLRAGREPAPSRTDLLAELRRAILAELRADPTVPPPSLGRRAQPWYRDAVAPMLAAISRREPRDLVVDLPSADGIVREVHATVSAEGVLPTPSGPPPPPVASWLARFEHHERRVLDAAVDPTPDTIHAALEADPLVADSDVEDFTDRMCRAGTTSPP